MKNLKAEMARRELTALQLAALIGMKPSTFYRKFQGYSEFSISEAFAISRALGEKIDYLFERTQSDQTIN